MSIAQVPFVEYKVVPNYQINTQGNLVPIENISNFQSGRKLDSTQQFTTICGYTITPNGKMKRIKIRVNSAESNGITHTFLREVFNSTSNSWFKCNTMVFGVDEQLDGEFISNNFEWKVENPYYGTIYFNF